MPNRVLIIAGPTASGKSRLAVDAARHYGGVVINADSQQVYKHIPILSACPSDDERKLIPHRLYEIYEPSRAGSVVDWLELAVAEIKKPGLKNCCRWWWAEPGCILTICLTARPQFRKRRRMFAAKWQRF